MELDPNAIRRAADQVGRAIRFTEDLQGMKVPWLLQRGSGTDRLMAVAGDAAEWSRSAEAAIGRLGAGFDDAHGALGELATALETGRNDGIRSARRGQALLGALGKTKTADTMLDTVQDGIAAHERGELSPFVLDLLNTHAYQGTGQMSAVRVLGEEFPDIGPARHFLREVKPGYANKEVEHAKLVLEDKNGTGLLEAFRGVITQQSEASKRATHVRDVFLEVASRLPGDPAARVPAWLDEAAAAGENVAISNQRYGELWLRSGAATHDQVASLVAERLATGHNSLSKLDLAFAAAAAELPGELRVEIPQLEGRPTIAEMLGVSTSGLHMTHKPFVDELYLRLLDDNPAVRAQHVEWLRAKAPGVERTRRLGMIGQQHPEAILGSEAARKPWAQDVLVQALEPKLNGSSAAGIDDAFDLARRTGGDRATILDEVERITKLPADQLTEQDVATMRGIVWLRGDARPRMGQPLIDELWSNLANLRMPTATSTGYKRFDDVALSIERERMAGDPSVTREAVTAEIDELLARNPAEMTVDDTRRLALLSELPADKRPLTPWGPDETTLSDLYQKRTLPRNMNFELDHMRLARDAERLAADSATTRAGLDVELDALLAKTNKELTIADIRRIATMSMLPDELRPTQSMVLTRSNLLSTGYVGRAISDPLAAAPFSSNGRVELDELRLARAITKVVDDPATTPSSVAAELEGLLAKPETELTIGDARRILVLTSLPEPLRPVLMDSMPVSALRVAASMGYDVADPTVVARLASNAKTELVRMRIGAERQRMLLDGATPASTEAELRELVAGTDDLEPDKLRRLAVLDGLPDEVLPRLNAISYDTTPLYERIATGNSAANLRRDVNSIRLSLEAADEAAANPRTREQLTDELARILVRPNSQIDEAAAHRMAVISRMPDDVRPELAPPTTQNYDLARVWLDKTHANSYGTGAFDAARQVVIRNSGIGLDELVSTVRAEDGSIELEKMAPMLRKIVVGAGTEQLERLGINDRTLLAAALGSARDGRVKAEVEAATREAHEIAARMEPRNETERVVIERLREQLDHSLGRIEKRVRGGYSNYVDYQNHGGAIANADLLKQLDDVTRAQEAHYASLDDGTAAAVDEALSW